MRDVRALHEEWMQRPGYRAEYEALEPEFALARALIAARTRAGLTQEQVAERMATSQSVVARPEAGRVRPCTRTFQRFAQATGTRLRISFDTEPATTPSAG